MLQCSQHLIQVLLVCLQERRTQVYLYGIHCFRHLLYLTFYIRCVWKHCCRSMLRIPESLQMQTMHDCTLLMATRK